MRQSLLIIPILFLFISCGENKELITEEYLDLHQKWKDARVKEVKEEWVPLVGLEWLAEGENTFGSDPENQVTFPGSTPPFIGSFQISDDTVRMILKPDQEVKTVNFEDLDSSVSIKEGMKMTLNNLEWMVIKRTGKYAVRIWDRTPTVTDSSSLKYFDVNSDWIRTARFEAYPEGSTYPIANVLGIVTDTPILGQLLFSYDGIEYGLDVMVGGKDTWFVIFGDKTNGEDTYGAGRYLYVPKVRNGKTTQVDFNKAYNPPCAFTEYATCPLPPPQNYLPFSIEAGEMNNYSDYL